MQPDQQSLRARAVHYREWLIQSTTCLVKVRMKALVVLIVTTLFLGNWSLCQAQQVKDNVYYSQMTQELKERLESEVQKQQSGAEVAFTVVITFDGNVHVFESPANIEEPFTYPRKASSIKNEYTATIVSFEGSHQCIDYIDTNGYKRRRCKRHE
jgi:hypothetical protein